MIIISLIALLFGAESLVKGASNLAKSFRVSPLVIGLTIVAFGTSLPELLVSTIAAYQGDATLAVANVVGSGIFNTLCILGAAAIICPLVVNQSLIRMDIPIMITATALLFVFCLYGTITHLMGILFLFLMIAYIFFSFCMGKQEELESPEHTNAFRNLLLILLGCLLLGWGADRFIIEAKELALFLGVSELIIGLTVVAFGTSLPELVTSLVAAFRGNRDMAVGNVVGSNIFNIFGVMGLSAFVSPNGLPIPQEILLFDLPILLISAIACLPIFFTGYLISRGEGVIFLSSFIVYVVYLVIQA